MYLQGYNGNVFENMGQKMLDGPITMDYLLNFVHQDLITYSIKIDTCIQDGLLEYNLVDICRGEKEVDSYLGSLKFIEDEAIKRTILRILNDVEYYPPGKSVIYKVYFDGKEYFVDEGDLKIYGGGT
jgi:hypothetical protein